MTQAPILALPDFSKKFILETEARNTGIGVVLIQEGKPVAYSSQALAPRHLGMSIYDKELLAVLMAIEKWTYYLEGRRFIIRTNYESLKFLSQQRAHNQLQREAITKLMGLIISFSIKKERKFWWQMHYQDRRIQLDAMLNQPWFLIGYRASQAIMSKPHGSKRY